MRIRSIILALLIFMNQPNIHAQATGEAAYETAEATKDSSWQNWTFVGVAAIVAAGAVYFVSINSGQPVADD